MPVIMPDRLVERCGGEVLEVAGRRRWPRQRLQGSGGRLTGTELDRFWERLGNIQPDWPDRCFYSYPKSKRVSQVF